MSARSAIASVGIGAHRARFSSAFTLLEIILAVAIATGLLLVVLYFYRQSAELREQVIRETERVAAVRLVMDRLTSELRTVPASSSATLPLYGDPAMLEFVRTDVPSRAAWAPADLGRVSNPESDLRLIRYSAGDGIVTFGLSREEEALVGRRVVTSATDALGFNDATSTNTPTVLTEEFSFVRFRFWDGRAWLDVWAEPSPPVAVEISLGFDPLPDDLAPDAYPHEVYRRVVHLPAGSPAEAAATPFATTHRREPAR